MLLDALVPLVRNGSRLSFSMFHLEGFGAMGLTDASRMPSKSQVAYLFNGDIVGTPASSS